MSRGNDERKADDGEDGPSDDDGDDRGSAKRKRRADEGSGEQIKIWKINEKVSLLDNDGDAFAHGFVIDGEPDATVWDQSSADNSQDPAGYWVIMKLTSVVNNAIDLPADSCFAHDGHDLGKNELKPRALIDLEEGILIWHDYLRPRMVASKSAKKAKKASSKGLDKGSKKSHR